MTYGIIKNKAGKTYVSPIFALKYGGFMSEVIAFDETFHRIQKINMWDSECYGGSRRVFVVKNDFDTGKGDWTGFDWLINDKALFKALGSKMGADIESFPFFKEYCREIHLPDIFEIKDDKDIESLIGVSFGFHDSLISKYNENENSIVIRFDTTWDCYITVTFEEVVEVDFKEKVGMILDSEIKKTEEGFLFTVLDGFAGWIDGCDFNSEMGEPYIKCKRIFWQIEIV